MKLKRQLEIVIATGNRAKGREIAGHLRGLRLKRMMSFGAPPQVEELGTTYEENAIAKARVWADRYNCIAVADDSGLEVTALGGRPGMRSARYADPGVIPSSRTGRNGASGTPLSPPASGGITHYSLPACDGKAQRSLLASGKGRGGVSVASARLLLAAPLPRHTARDPRNQVRSAISEKERSKRNIEKLLRELDGVPAGRRHARFVAAVAIALPQAWMRHIAPVRVESRSLPYVARGTCAGRITRRPRGSGGFGYDPVFRSDALRKTFAEAGTREKNRVSHRARALLKVRKFLEKRIARLQRLFPRIPEMDNRRSNLHYAR